MRYLLFAGHDYYPDGGIDDLRHQADTIDELKQYFKDNHRDISGHSYTSNWGHIVDAETFKVALRGSADQFDNGVIFEWREGVEDE